ncbi:HAD family hydrolase [Hamadaea tsunoensis]|uniref:HAD family hydrolase n=1 Tax=Hamadaea tsunoensis TaxID=53368 RepID=UPI0004157BAE|nr:HAD-IB family phosphatase [Hamadaea tsunoensis]
MSRLHLFDMDGTLIRGSSANIEIAKVLGKVEEFRSLDREFAAGTIDSREYANRAYEMWSTLTDEVVAMAFAGAPWLAGIRDVWQEITDRGEHCAVISLSPSFFVSRLRVWGVHETHAARFPEVPFPVGTTIDTCGVLTPAAKVTIADELCARYGVDRSDCVAYGDSMSDAVLFTAVGTSVAVNGDHHVSGIATHRYAGGDLREAYRLVAG